MPRSIRFYIRNRWIETGVSINASSEESNYPAENTQTPALDETWRTNQISSSYIYADLGQTRKIGAIGLVRCNLSFSGTYRMRVANSASFSSSLFDSGTRTRTRYYSDEEIVVAKTSEFFSVGIPRSSTLQKLQRQVIICELPSEVTGRYVRIDFTDPSNPDLYLELGTVYAGRILQPNDLMFNWKIQRDNIVRNGQAACGQYWSASVRRKTLVDFTLAPQHERDVLSHWFLLQTLIGVNDPFIVSLTDRTNSLNFTTTIYGKWVTVPIISATGYRSYNIPMQVEEIVG